jgi:tRNA threonylcarbamoyladenosine biosynthesis protein TsaE
MQNKRHKSRHVLNTKTISTSETISVAAELFGNLGPGDIVLLTGDIGAGKTQFAKGIAKGLGVTDIDEVNSPTYDLVHSFEGRLNVHHLDLYRLESVNLDDREWLEEYFELGGVCVVEWGERALPIHTDYFLVTLGFTRDEDERVIKVEKYELD